MKRAMIFIDGSNFYHRLKELCRRVEGKTQLIEFDYQKFSGWLVAPNQCVATRYYVGAIRRVINDEKSERMYADQQKLLARLQRININVTLGTLIRHPDKTIHEKGVDVRLAVEMIRFARQNAYDIGYLISSDTDLVAAVEEVQSLGKEILYVGITKGQSFGLTKVSNDVRLLRYEDIEMFIPKVSIP